MPFTLSHPAAVLPLTRRPFVTTGLMVGSMAPDVPYFVKLRPGTHTWYEPFLNATETHTWPGMFVRGVPLAVVMLGLWWVVDAPMRALWGADPRPTVRPHPLWLVTSIGIGIVTHVAWDSFAHITELLRDASTAIGLVVVAWWLKRRWISPRNLPAVLAAFGITALIGIIVGIAFASRVDPGASPAAGLRTFVEGALVGVAAPALAYGVGWRLLDSGRRARH